MTLFDFNLKTNLENWSIVNDVVMGGRSNSSIDLNKKGHGIFEGYVSLENNGGFAMTQYYFDKVSTSNYSKFLIRIKGDGKTYQFRVKSKASDEYSYISTFKTSTEWTIIEIPFNTMYPSYRGKRLNFENYSGEHMEMIAFLIGNKKNESFKLEIDSISLK